MRQSNVLADKEVHSGRLVAGRLKKAADFVEAQLAKAGLTVNGSNPWDPQIYNLNTYWRVLRDGTLGAGESYMDHWWDCEQLDEMISRAMTARLDETLKGRWTYFKHWLLAHLINLQSEKRAYQVGQQHYDVGNDLYQAMLDPTMAYSCGYWKEADNLHQAQLAKLDLVCRKLDLQPNETVLDIGCGWGSFAEFAAKHYGVQVTGLTISREQKQLAQQRCQHLPVHIELKDYRKMQGQFDKLVSIGMFEHVGYKNYRTYMRTAYRLMKDKGIFVLHTIGSDQTAHMTNPWIHKYIFPNGAIPSLAQITRAAEPYFVVEDVHNFGLDYDRTLMAWQKNFDQAWSDLQKHYDTRFYRMWNYYLKISAGAFRSRALQLYQVVLRKRLLPLAPYFSQR